jgi:DNA-directed RNA polymerase II subunit RPB1
MTHPVVKKIKAIQFSLSNPADIIKHSVCEVSTVDLYEKNKPTFHGLFDTRMGIVDSKYKCVTCEHTMKTCPGHFGHITLVNKVYSPHFLKTLVKVLQSICFHCSELLTTEKITHKKNQTIFNTVVNLSKGKTQCPHCEQIQPKISKDNVSIFYSFDKEKLILSADACWDILTKITDENSKNLGFNPEYSRPEWMIISVLPVGPPCIRPSVFIDNGNSSEADLTYKYLDIIKTNTALRDEIKKYQYDLKAKKKALGETDTSNDTLNTFIEKRTTIIEDRYKHLQIHVTTTMNNKLKNVPVSQNRNNRPFKSFTEKIVSKHGRIRGNLMGKRVDFSARSVITPDPSLDIDELGMPIEMAMKLTIPETITQYNIDEMQKRVDNGVNVHPGVLFIKKADSVNKISIGIIHKRIEEGKQELKDLLQLSLGDVIDRHVNDGDFVLFNRQPSLHKFSMMGHRVRVLPAQTFRMNPNVCTPYNADFDGDEMNAHVPQSIQSQIELSELVAIPHQIISPQSSKPVIGCIQDTLLGCNKMTQPNVMITKREAMIILAHLKELPKNYDASKEFWSGRDFFSLILPKINYKNGKVVIQNGKLLQGCITKKHMGTATGSLIHVIWNDYGSYATSDFMNNVNIITNRWLMSQGTSVGFSDTVADRKTLQDIDTLVKNSQLEVHKTIAGYQQKQFDNQQEDDVRQEFEATVINQLNGIRDSTGSLASKNVLSNNRINDMVTTGSKGSILNISQIMANVGQQVVKTNGQSGRVEDGFIDRPLPHFNKYDITPEARGFVSSSYLQGLKPIEFFYHSMSGREGLIDTACKTSDTGYLQRRLIKSMEDLCISYSNCVQTGRGQVIQFIYGGDSMDACYLEKQFLEICTCDNASFEETFIFNQGQIKEVVTKSKYPQSDNYQDDFIHQLKTLRQELHDNNYQDHVMVPFNLDRIINSMNHEPSKRKLQYSYNEVLDKLENLISKLHINHILNDFHDLYVKNCRLVIYSKLSPKQVLYKYKFTKKQFDGILTLIYERFTRAIIQPGEMVGAITAQSIGEKLTQMTLNSFHSAGIASKTKITSGIPRFRELINVTKSPSNTSMEIHLNEHYSRNEEQATVLLEQLQYTELRDFIDRIDICYHETGNDIIYSRNNKWFQEPIGDSPMVLVITLNAAGIFKKKIFLPELYESIVSSISQKDFSILCSDDNDALLQIHIRPLIHDQSNLEKLKTLAKELPKTYICGIKGVNETFLRSIKKQVVNELGQVKQEEHFVIDTNGGKLVDVLGLSFVNPELTNTTDIYDTFNTFGMEASRELLFRELKLLLADNGIAINDRHLELLVDNITHNSMFISMDRHGINKADVGPLARASFEESVDHLTKAAVFSQRDNLQGVTPNIMIGQMGRFGTGMGEIVIDTTKLK